MWRLQLTIISQAGKVFRTHLPHVRIYICFFLKQGYRQVKLFLRKTNKDYILDHLQPTIDITQRSKRLFLLLSVSLSEITNQSKQRLHEYIMR